MGNSGGTAITAAILCLVGALWYGVDTIRKWQGVEAVFQIVGNATGYGLSDSDAIWAYASVAALVTRLTCIPLLLLGGFLLVNRQTAGRKMAIWGAVFVVVSNALLALVAFRTFGWLNSLAEEMGASSVAEDVLGEILLETGLPAAIAIVALILLTTSSTRQWCNRTAPRTY